MSQDTQDIDSMSEAELSAALKSGVDELDGKTEAEPTPKEEVKVETEEAKAEPVVETETESDEEGNPYRKRIDRLLRKRDTLSQELSEKDRLLAEKEAEIARLKGEEKEEETDVASTINRVLDERDKKTKSALESIKAQEDEFTSLAKKVPGALNRKSEILELAEKHPTLTFEAIDRLLAPEDHVDPIEKNRKNAKRMDVGSRSRADLESEKDVTKASVSEQEKYLKEMERSGKLVI